MTQRCEVAAQVVCADAGFHADQARRHIGEPRFHLATRPLLPQHDGAARIVAHDMERVLANIDADYGDRGMECLGHGVLLVFGAPGQLRLLAGQEHGRTIPLTEVGTGEWWLGPVQFRSFIGAGYHAFFGGMDRMPRGSTRRFEET